MAAKVGVVWSQFRFGGGKNSELDFFKKKRTFPIRYFPISNQPFSKYQRWINLTSATAKFYIDGVTTFILLVSNFLSGAIPLMHLFP